MIEYTAFENNAERGNTCESLLVEEKEQQQSRCDLVKTTGERERETSARD